MLKSYYVIVKEENCCVDCEEQSYWDELNGTWTTEVEEATRYDQAILCGPLPVGTGGIIHLTENFDVLDFFKTETLPVIGDMWV